MGNLIKARSLTERGYPEHLIKQMCHMAGSPFFQRVPGGIWYVKEERLEQFLDELAERKENV